MFRHAESPGAAGGVTRVFPDGFDAALEEVYAVAEGQQGGVEVVEERPEGADVIDFGEADQALFVGGAAVVGGGLGARAATVLTVVPKVPAVD